MKKILYFLLLILLGTGCFNFFSRCYADEIGEIKYAYRAEKGFYSIQKWNGSEWIYVTYSRTYYKDSNGKERVAYCVDPSLIGIGWISGEVEGYDLKITEKLQNEKLWRVYTNGFPYKTPEQLGVETEDDAYLATKMASYAILRSENSEDIRNKYRAGEDRVAGQSLEDINRRGQKVINAICNLVDIGNNGSQKIIENDILQITKDGEIQEDKNNLYQVYKVTSKTSFNEYKVHSNIESDSIFEITDLNGNKKTKFSSNEKFKISIKKADIKENINLRIEIEADCKVDSIFYGKCEHGDYQNYMLCANEYSTVFSNKIDLTIEAKESQITIVKRDKDTLEAIEGVEFEIIDANGNIVDTKKTDKDGKLNTDKLFPGKYTIKEIKKKDSYKDENISKDIELNYKDTKIVEIYNEKKKGSIKIVKIDANNNEIKLQGVKFQIFNSENIIVAELITNENGEAEIGDLPIEYEYYIKELETLNEYKLNNEVVKVTLEENEIKSIIFKNEKIEEKLPRTGLYLYEYIIIAISIIMGIIGLAIIYKLK